MLIRKIVAAVVFGSIFLSAVAHAYDLPKIEAENATENQKSFGSDWTAFEQFIVKIETLLAEGTLTTSSSERVFIDKNLIFIDFYDGKAYFLDKYSIKISADNKKKRSWSQRIYPIGKGISYKNSKATLQKFCMSENKYYNSLRRSDEISALEDDSDRKFLEVCFNVGYYCAFNKQSTRCGISR